MSVEVTTKYATTAPTIQGCFGFVMDHLDQVGEAPSVTVSPYWTGPNDSLMFEVTVEATRTAGPQ